MNSDLILDDNETIKLIAKKIECSDKASLTLANESRSFEMRLDSESRTMTLGGENSGTTLSQNGIHTDGFVTSNKARVHEECLVGAHLEVGITQGNATNPEQGKLVINGENEDHSITIDGNNILVKMARPTSQPSSTRGKALVDLLENRGNFSLTDNLFGSASNHITVDLVDLVLQLKSQVEELERKLAT